ncbi:MAG: hypothetical protein EZS28_005222 [Streblomastix strix]|uniref:Uncharacterized protein n=1 Tax=Streblomastix strix TaxID=222440 RepID=A0A5J4WW53_9EUKA|nr:MAG: hypothetical protein EZS28_005222 [Streblomastix strix]
MFEDNGQALTIKHIVDKKNYEVDTILTQLLAKDSKAEEKDLLEIPQNLEFAPFCLSQPMINRVINKVKEKQTQDELIIRLKEMLDTVDNTLRDNGVCRASGEYRRSLNQRNENSEEEHESTSGQDINFRPRLRQEGTRLFRYVQKQSKLSNDAVQTIIDNMQGSWRIQAYKEVIVNHIVAIIVMGDLDSRKEALEDHSALNYLIIDLDEY